MPNIMPALSANTYSPRVCNSDAGPLFIKIPSLRHFFGNCPEVCDVVTIDLDASRRRALAHSYSASRI